MYKHIIQYYETDKMGVVHHSNYIRFMEEARIDFFKSIGFDYFELEKSGVFSPVVAINNCKYRKPTCFGDEIFVDVKVIKYNGVRIALQYKMYVKDTFVFEGESEHCFINSEGKILKLGENTLPEFNRKLIELTQKGE